MDLARRIVASSSEYALGNEVDVLRLLLDLRFDFVGERLVLFEHRARRVLALREFFAVVIEERAALFDDVEVRRDLKYLAAFEIPLP